MAIWGNYNLPHSILLDYELAFLFFFVELAFLILTLCTHKNRSFLTFFV